MNLRSQAILSTLNHISSIYHNEPLNIIEIGCMFNKGEGMSTYLIADFLSKRPAGGKFVSIEYDQDHIEACKNIIQTRNSSLNKQIEYRHGHSLTILPEVLADFNVVHFVFQDGGAHPEVCLVEFELSKAHLIPDGVILVDDVHQLQPTNNYELSRPFGKATLIYPMLILSNYLKNRETIREANSVGFEGAIPSSQFINNLEISDDSILNFSTFKLIGIHHRMLLYGNSIEAINLSKLDKISFMRYIINKIKRLWGNSRYEP